MYSPKFEERFPPLGRIVVSLLSLAIICFGGGYTVGHERLSFEFFDHTRYAVFGTTGYWLLRRSCGCGCRLTEGFHGPNLVIHDVEDGI
jgi:hypothetical protein